MLNILAILLSNRSVERVGQVGILSLGAEKLGTRQRGKDRIKNE